MKEKLKKNKNLILWTMLWIYYSFFSVIIYYDSGHYMGLVSIMEGRMGVEAWDIIRGPVFPAILYVWRRIFGRSPMSATLLTFIFYAFMLFIVRKILYFVVSDIKDSRIKKVTYYGIIGLIILNPIIFGYFHALLTEFVAIPIALLMCYLAWKWIDSDYFRQKKIYIFSTVFFGVMTVFSWHLKQPFVAIVLFPLLIASVISIFETRTISNVIQKSVTLLFCFILLFSSIKIWNHTLEGFNINLNSDRNVIQGFGKSLIGGSRNLHVLSDYSELFLEYEKDPFFSDEEKQFITDRKNEDMYTFAIVDIYDVDGKNIIDRKILDLKNSSSISAIQALKFIGETFLEYPKIVFDGYLTGYFLLSDLYVRDPSAPHGILKELDFYNYENAIIGSSIVEWKSNISEMLPDMEANVESYRCYNAPPLFLRTPLRLSALYYQYFYCTSMAFLPLLCIIVLILRLVNRKKLNSKDKKEYNLLIILLFFSFMNAMVYVFTGSCIDRYMAVAMIPMMLSFGIIFKRFINRLFCKCI